jgi:NADPH:quinone reductase-like Zn-dependent oxidoreductase
VRLTSDNKGVLGVNMAHLWDEHESLHAWADQLLAWLEEGAIAPVVDRVFPLEEAAAAHRTLHERRNIGKVVLRP